MTAFSVVIPAHNEQATVGRLLYRLRELDSSAEVVVVCNGCTDATAERSRELAPWAKVVEIAEASKPAALRRGDETVDAMPRLYLDADVLLGSETVRRLVEVLEAGPWLAVAPSPLYMYTDARWPVRGHYQIWAALARKSNAVSGTGAILISADGRRRFGAWPDLIGDDAFVNGLFSHDERCRVADAYVVVDLPTRLLECVRRRARVHQGNRDAAKQGMRPIDPDRYRGRTLARLVRQERSLVVHLPAHAFVTLSVRALAAWRRVRGTHGQFHRGRDR